MQNMKTKAYLFGKLCSAFILILALGLNACTSDLDKMPTNGITNSEQYSTVAGYKQVLATLLSYPAYNNFLRYYWEMQEYPTDEALGTWDDDGNTQEYHKLDWSADLTAISNVYSVVLTGITYCNNFINEASDANVAKRGFTGNDATAIKQYLAEAKFLRAYFYWILMDEFANPPFPTEETLGYSNPTQIKRADLFIWIESQLKSIDSDLADPKTNEWGRPDKAAAWSLLARMYLNASVYTGTAHYTDAITYCNKVIGAGYSLESCYNWLMLGDNYKNTNEFIFTINYTNTMETWGGTNFFGLGAAGVTGDINGMSSSWGNFRTTSAMVDLFPSSDTLTDKRAEFYTTGQTLDITSMSVQTNGYSFYKYRNKDRSGTALTQNNSYGNLSDIDFPVFRLAEIYLIYAESVLRGGSGGSTTTALSYINQLRGRAYANNPQSTTGTITQSALTTDFILEERARELYWEAQRRTDLVRYGKLTTSDYLWPWKGNVAAGRAVDSKYNIFPIPTSDLLSNTNLTQNTGY
jgi:starch-binding outer membrane protein, SusD/RagB family